MLAAELGQYVERAVDNVDLEELADSMGVDAAAARSWIENAGGWLRANAENLGDEFAGRSREPGARRSAPTCLQAPRHPLDLPTDEQGAALAALDSGRWTVEPGTHALVPRGDGPGPTDALGIALELHIRDWTGADGTVTAAGRHALSRWLDANERSLAGRRAVLSDRFRAAVERGDLGAAEELFSDDAVFRSPVLFKPYEGRDQVLRVLRAAERVLGVDHAFRYVHQLEDPDDRVAMLEFATTVDGKQVEGIDKLTFDEDGAITELKVLIRPASALQLVGAKMAEEFPKVGLGLPA